MRKFFRQPSVSILSFVIFIDALTTYLFVKASYTFMEFNPILRKTMDYYGLEVAIGLKLFLAALCLIALSRVCHLSKYKYINERTVPLFILTVYVIMYLGFIQI